jgi:hypothetical protein
MTVEHGEGSADGPANGTAAAGGPWIQSEPSARDGACSHRFATGGEPVRGPLSRPPAKHGDYRGIDTDNRLP